MQRNGDVLIQFIIPLLNPEYKKLAGFFFSATACVFNRDFLQILHLIYG